MVSGIYTSSPNYVPNASSIVGAGSAYNLTATPAAVDLGTTDPAITLPGAGTYLIMARAKLDYVGATFAAVRTATVKLRRTNNTAADLTGGSLALSTEIITTLTYTMEQCAWQVVYTTANADDAITIFGDVSVLPTAGNLQVTDASIIAIRLT